MRRMIAVAALLAGSCAVPQPEQQGPPVELAGRVAGPPQRCVTIDQMSSLRISENDPHTILYGNGRIIWASHLGQCRFRHDDVLVTEPFGGNHCRGDIVKSIDRVSHIPGPTCILGDFVPFRR